MAPCLPAECRGLCYCTADLERHRRRCAAQSTDRPLQSLTNGGCVHCVGCLRCSSTKVLAVWCPRKASRRLMSVPRQLHKPSGMGPPSILGATGHWARRIQKIRAQRWPYPAPDTRYVSPPQCASLLPEFRWWQTRLSGASLAGSRGQILGLPQTQHAHTQHRDGKTG